MHRFAAVSNQEGMTLIEVIVAVAILGIAVVGLIGALATGLRVTTIVEEQSTTASLATTAMEEAVASCNTGTTSMTDPAGFYDARTESQVQDSGVVSTTVTILTEDGDLFAVSTMRACAAH